MRFYLRNDFPDRPGIYYVCWTDESGRPQRRSTRARDRAAAEVARARVVLELDQPRDQRLDEVTIQAALVRYYHHHGRSRSSRDPIRFTLAKVNRHLPRVTIAAFDRACQTRFLAALTADGCSPGTQSRYMGVIRSALRWAHERGEIPATPPLVRPELAETDGVEPFTLDEMRAVLNACRTEAERLMVLVWVATLCRPSAALDLTWDRVTATAIDFKVPGARITKKRRAVVPVAPSAAAYLEARRSIGPVVRSDRGKAVRAIRFYKPKFRRICARAGVAGSAYCVRKFGATWLRAHGVPEADVTAMLAHRFGGTQTEKYAKVRVDFMAAARDGIERMLRELAPAWLPLVPLASERQGTNANDLNLNAANGAFYGG